VSVSEANATKLLPVCVVHENQQLQVHTNVSSGTAVATGTSNAAYPGSTSDWNGTIEETRGYDYAVNASQRSEYHSDPTLAVTGPAPQWRLTYDTRGSLGGTLPVHFASGDATVTNATLVSGFSDPGINAGSDYKLAGDSIEILNGQLDANGEVLFIEFNLEGVPLGLLGVGIALFALAVFYIPLRSML
jgi:hypothetical protein